MILWKFRVKSGREKEFEQAYGPDGDWAQFFRRGTGYIKTELYQDQEGIYLTIDEWESRESYEKFKEHFQQEYKTLDRKFEALTEEEILICSTAKANS